MTSVDDQNRILRSCHADATCGHFGVTKTWRRLAERFYWRGMYQDAKKLVSDELDYISYLCSSVLNYYRSHNAVSVSK